MFITALTTLYCDCWYTYYVFSYGTELFDGRKCVLFKDGGASHGGSEKPGKLEVGGASRDSTGLGALEEGLISS